MMNVNSPSVMIWIGSVSRIRIGRKIALTIPSTKAATSAPTTPVTLTPGKMYATIRRATALTITRMRKCIGNSLSARTCRADDLAKGATSAAPEQDQAEPGYFERGSPVPTASRRVPYPSRISKTASSRLMRVTSAVPP